VGELQRRATVTAAAAAVLSVVALSVIHEHEWIAFVVMGLQVVLIVTAVKSVVQMKRVIEAENDYRYGGRS
jgi:hypothetical protein